MRRFLNVGGDESQADDSAIGALARWALREQVSGQEPSPRAWQGIQARLASPQARQHRSMGWSTLAPAALALVVILATGAYDISFNTFNTLDTTVTTPDTVAVQPTSQPVIAEAAARPGDPAAKQTAAPKSARLPAEGAYQAPSNPQREEKLPPYVPEVPPPVAKTRAPRTMQPLVVSNPVLTNQWIKTPRPM